MRASCPPYDDATFDAQSMFAACQRAYRSTLSKIIDRLDESQPNPSCRRARPDVNANVQPGRSVTNFHSALKRSPSELYEANVDPVTSTVRGWEGNLARWYRGERNTPNFVQPYRIRSACKNIFWKRKRVETLNLSNAIYASVIVFYKYRSQFFSFSFAPG